MQIGLTNKSKPYQKPDSGDHEDNVQKEVLVVIDANTVVNPRTVTVLLVSDTDLSSTWSHLLIFPSYTPPTTPAMFTP